MSTDGRRASMPPGTPGPDVGANAFTDAVDAYRDAFGDVPHLWRLPDYELAARVLRLAVARGRPIRPYLISRLSGSWRGPPPRGVLI